jgi:nicotinamide phosphoribosyltransferase
MSRDSIIKQPPVGFKVKLPPPKIHDTPRILMADAYTIGSNEFESKEAKEKSVYYLTFRRALQHINPHLYSGKDTRFIFYGLGKILHYLFYNPITHAEINEAKKFLQTAQINSKGELIEYSFPEEIWREVVNKYNGRPPILIRALREGSVFYPNEPVIQIESMVEGMGVLAAWFESKLLQVWAQTEMLTQLEHWLMYCKQLVRKIYGDSIDEKTVEFYAGLLLHNFGDRAGICPQESEWLSETALLTFSGTDTFAGAYQAWKNANEVPGVAMSVKALAHRNIQSYEKEFDCFRALYDSAKNNDIDSYVADCYDFWTAVEGDGSGTDGSLLSLALESKRTGSGKVVVARPDSGDPVEQILWLCRLALKHGLYEEVEINGKKWRLGTTLKFIEGDGMTWEKMQFINDKLIEYGFIPFAWGLYGVGGGLRNALARDNSSTKYALNAVGNDLRPVCKFSETIGKTTLPGPFKLRREEGYLQDAQTIAFEHEEGEDALEVWFNGLCIWEPFGSPQSDDFFTIKARKAEQLKTMPETLTTEENHGYPASDLVRQKRIDLLKEYAPKKLPQNY